tara:strand:+ start:307 stop:669 length:363 start_codon:yes stop_codon:yes gene_type:complete
MDVNDIQCNLLSDSDENNTQENKTQDQPTQEQIISFLKDLFPQYDEDVLFAIYTYTTNLDETLKKLFQMNKVYDIDAILNHCKKNVKKSPLKPPKYKGLLSSLTKTMSTNPGYTTLHNEE